jgi:hypothetical protein
MNDRVKRLTDAKAAEKQAHDDAKVLIDGFLKAANILREWETKSIGFEYREGDTPWKSIQPAERTIVLDGLHPVPSLTEIRKALKAWNDAKDAVGGAMNQFTRDELETLRKAAH